MQWAAAGRGNARYVRIEHFYPAGSTLLCQLILAACALYVHLKLCDSSRGFLMRRSLGAVA